MVGYMNAWLFESRVAYIAHEGQHKYTDEENCVHSDVNGQQGYDLGEFNEYEGPLDELIDAVRLLTQTAFDKCDFTRLRFLNWIIADCLECQMRYVVIRNV